MLDSIWGLHGVVGAHLRISHALIKTSALIQLTLSSITYTEDVVRQEDRGLRVPVRHREVLHTTTGQKSNEGSIRQMSNVILNVPDISCGHCERTVTGALLGKPGVNSVRVDIPAKQVHLDYDPAITNLEQVSEILDDEGYAVAGVQGASAEDKPKRTFIPLFKR